MRLPGLGTWALLSLTAVASAAAPVERMRVSLWGTGGDDDIQAAAVAADGTMYVVGNTGAKVDALPGGVKPIVLGKDVPNARCGHGFIMHLSADGGTVLHYAQLGKGIALVTSVAAVEGGVYVSGYASKGLEEVVAGLGGMTPAYPLKDEAAPAGARPSEAPGLGDRGAPFVVRLPADLSKVEAGTYLEGWQQVYRKGRYMGKGRRQVTEYFWQPVCLAPTADGDVIVLHDGGYSRANTEADRARTRDARLLERLTFYDVGDWLSRLDGKLSQRRWRLEIKTPPVDPAVAGRLKNGWPLAHYGNARTHRMRKGPDGNVVLGGWSATHTSNEPWWSPYLWKVDASTGKRLWSAYEYDPMSGGGNRMGGQVADSAVITVLPLDDGNILASLKADGGNSVIRGSPLAVRNDPADGPLKGRMPHIANVVHHWGVAVTLDGRTRRRLGGTLYGSRMDGSAGPAWAVDLAAGPDGQILAWGRYNFTLDWTDDAWAATDTGTTTSAFVRTYTRDWDMTFSTAVPGILPFEAISLPDQRVLLVGQTQNEGLTPELKESLLLKSPGGRDGFFMILRWAPQP